MQPIEPIGIQRADAAFAQQAQASLGTAPTNPAAQSDSAQSMVSESSAVTSMSITTSSTAMTAVSGQVGAFLSGIDSQLAGNEYLKLLIAALILNVLLNQGGGNGQDGQSALKALESLAGGSQTALYISLESSTNTVQIQQQSFRLDSVEAVQSAWQSADAPAQQGSRLDESA